MWFLYLIGLCIVVLIATATIWAVVFMIGLIKLTIKDMKSENFGIGARKNRW